VNRTKARDQHPATQSGAEIRLNLIPDMTFSSIQNYANPTMNDGTPYFNQKHYLQHHRQRE